MKVKLKVLHGKNAGRELQIVGPHFIIGRGEDCHLRAKSDMISRRHCAILVGDSKVSVRDLKSKNGCFVNGEKIDEELVLKMGDRITIGPLQFEVLIDHTLGASKKPKVQDIKEAASRTAGGSTDDVDISSWLKEHDEIERERRANEPDTRQFKLEETDEISLSDTETAEVSSEEVVQQQKRRIPEKKAPGKLPKIEKEEAKDTREAAADTLKRLFKR